MQMQNNNISISIVIQLETEGEEYFFRIQYSILLVSGGICWAGDTVGIITNEAAKQLSTGEKHSHEGC